MENKTTEERSYNQRQADLTQLVGLTVEELKRLVALYEQTSDYDGQAQFHLAISLRTAFRESGFKVSHKPIYQLLCELFNPEHNPFRK